MVMTDFLVIQPRGVYYKLNGFDNHLRIWLLFSFFSNNPSFGGPDQPPSRYEMAPYLGPASLLISVLCSDHNRNKKGSGQLFQLYFNTDI